MAGRWREQWYYSNHNSSESTKQNGKMEVVDTAQHRRGRVHNATSRRREGKLQHHPTHTHHQAHHQAPERTLNTHKNTCRSHYMSPLFGMFWTSWCTEHNSCSTHGSNKGVFALRHSHFPIVIICHHCVISHTRAVTQIALCHCLCSVFSKECDLCSSMSHTWKIVILFLPLTFLLLIILLLCLFYVKVLHVK